VTPEAHPVPDNPGYANGGGRGVVLFFADGSYCLLPTSGYLFSIAVFSNFEVILPRPTTIPTAKAPSVKMMPPMKAKVTAKSPIIEVIE